MASVQLKLGDMFDGPSDLIVLPCSTSGTITPFVRNRLVHHRIPYPQTGMRLGDLAILPFEGGENIAQFVAFACSVNRDHSTVEAIELIGQKLGEATQSRSTIRRVAAPLLGTGAGGLDGEAVADALARGFKRESHNDAQLIVHVLKQDVFQRISSVTAIAPQVRQVAPLGKESNESKDSSPIRVFISYSHTSPELEKWVEALGTFLRKNGLDARLDVWHLRRGMDLPQFMTNELTLANRVVLVSDERYAEKADGRVGGVGWETMIIQGDMARLAPSSTKYLVIIRSADVDAGLPQYLKTKFCIHWPQPIDDSAKCDLLLRELYDVVRIPILGQRPVFL